MGICRPAELRNPWVACYPNVITLRSSLCCRKVCLAVCNVSLPYSRVQTFGNIFSPLYTFAILWPPCKILRRLSKSYAFYWMVTLPISLGDPKLPHFTRTWLRYVRVFAIANPSVVCHLSSVCRCLSVTLVQPTQRVVPFGNISSPLCTLAIQDRRIVSFEDE